MINNFRGYYWLNKTFDYIQKPGELIKMEKIIKVTSLHGSFIKISDQDLYSCFKRKD